MRIPRIFEPREIIAPEDEFSLGEDGSGHVGRVLRMQEGMKLVIFNGTGTDYPAVITAVTRKEVTVKITEAVKISNESPLSIILGQVISRGEKMEFTIQKAVELGVAEITPLNSRYCGVRLPADRLEKKCDQWRKIIISACEQCGRSVIPKLNPVMTLEEFLDYKTSAPCLNLHPRAPTSISGMKEDLSNGVRLIIGSEGGLSQEEIELARSKGCTEVLLGPRVLRTETAALTAISILQNCYGDMK
jgi:16S rRNA (uracil1498-N3)-methyltransferase